MTVYRGGVPEDLVNTLFVIGERRNTRSREIIAALEAIETQNKINNAYNSITHEIGLHDKDIEV